MPSKSKKIFPGIFPFIVLGSFLPCYLFTIIPAPYFKRYGRLPSIKAFIDGVTSAAIGAITGAVVVLRSLLDFPTVLIAIISAFLLWRFKKIEEPFQIIAAALVGFLVTRYFPRSP